LDFSKQRTRESNPFDIESGVGPCLDENGTPKKGNLPENYKNIELITNILSFLVKMFLMIKSTKLCAFFLLPLSSSWNKWRDAKNHSQ